jgi:hypothetical protein
MKGGAGKGEGDGVPWREHREKRGTAHQVRFPSERSGSLVRQDSRSRSLEGWRPAGVPRAWSGRAAGAGEHVGVAG